MFPTNTTYTTITKEMEWEYMHVYECQSYKWLFFILKIYVKEM